MANLETQPLEVTDFSGGMTDRYIDGAINRFKRADNFLLIKHGQAGKLITRPGSVVYDLNNPHIPTGNQRIGALINFDNDGILLVQSARNLYYINGTYQTLSGPSGGSALTTGTTANVISHTQWNHHLLLTSDAFGSHMKSYVDATGVLQVRNAGLPYLASSPTITPTAGTNSYLYAFHYWFPYDVGLAPVTTHFEDFGPTTIVQVASAAVPSSSSPIVLSNLPSIAPGTENYDTTKIRIKIYRTNAGGTTLYLVGDVANGTTTFSDTTSDLLVVNGQLIYTTGGVLDNEQPKPSKYIHVAHNNICWYAHVKEGTEIKTNRVRQSNPNDPDSCPGSFYVDIEEEITGISSVNSVPVVFGEKGVYRLDGSFDIQGNGEIKYTKIADDGGCISHQSIVQTIHGVFYAGNDGFYFTDAYRVTKLSEELNDTFHTLVANDNLRKFITGTFDRTNSRIYWSAQTDSSSLDNDSCYVMDMKWGIKPDMPFTTLSGGTSFTPTAITFFNGQLIRADSRGYLFKHDDQYASDPKINPLLPPSQWNTQAIIYDYISCASSFGTNFIRKFVPRMNFVAKNRTNLSMQIISNNDDNRQIENLAQIRFRGNVTWGDPDVIWGDANLQWNYDGIIEYQRRFPSNALRCAYKQIEMTNAKTVITSSSTIGAATLDPVAKTLTLNSGSTAAWPTDAVDYSITFSLDGYLQEYVITGRTDTTLTLSSSGSFPMAASYQWEMKGFPKNEKFDLMGYVIHYALLGKTQNQYQAGDDGANP